MLQNTSTHKTNVSVIIINIVRGKGGIDSSTGNSIESIMRNGGEQESISETSISGNTN